MPLVRTGSAGCPLKDALCNRSAETVAGVVLSGWRSERGKVRAHQWVARRKLMFSLFDDESDNNQGSIQVYLMLLGMGILPHMLLHVPRVQGRNDGALTGGAYLACGLAPVAGVQVGAAFTTVVTLKKARGGGYGKRVGDVEKENDGRTTLTQLGKLP